MHVADESTRQGSGPSDPLLHGARHLEPGRRSLLLQLFTRIVYPTTAVVAVYLLLTGLHHPGGAFAAGLTVGLALLLRRVVGGPRELGAAMPVKPGILLGVGLLIAAGYGVAGLVITGDLLHGTVLHLDPPLLPVYALPTSLIFETGILLITVGVVLDVIRTLGEEAHGR